MRTVIIERNALKKDPSNVWMKSQRDINTLRDDGLPYEKIREILKNTKDLSSSGIEIQRKYPQGDYEYETLLSPKRANLLRFFNLKGVGLSLEIGCQCGALTRYLAETGTPIDAIEASYEKASLSRLRCKDLDNVEIIHSNYADIHLPENTYDAIYLVGVVDEALNFFPKAQNAFDATVTLVKKAAGALKNEGVLVIAADNRQGLKYWLGASEKQHKRPYEGLYGYPGKGLKTFNRKEWISILNQIGICNYRILYPFPDFLFPKVILSENFILKDPHAFSLLYRVESKDYFKTRPLPAIEYFIWRNLHKSGQLVEYANSFLMVACNSEKKIEEFIENDFVFFSDSGRRPGFRSITKKPKGHDIVIKASLSNQADVSNKKQGVNQSFTQKPYYRGRLLSDRWLDAVYECLDTREFEKWLKQYRDFVFKYLKQSESSKNTVDILPFNIIIDEKGGFHVIDDEWIWEETLTPEFILFRALMWFAKNNEKAFGALCKIKGINTIKEFIEYGFRVLSLDNALKIDAFSEQEEKLQTAINFQKSLKSIKRMVEEPIAFKESAFQLTPFSSQLFWAGIKKDFSENKSVYVFGYTGRDRQHLVFPFNIHGETLRWMKLKPVNQKGYFTLYSLCLKHINNRETRVLSLSSPDQIAAYATLENVNFNQGPFGQTYLSLNQEPYFIFEINEKEFQQKLEGFFQLEIEIDWPKTKEYYLFKDALEKASSIYTQLQEKHLKRIKGKNREIERKNREIEGKNREIERKNREIGEIQEDINRKKYEFIKLQIRENRLKDENIELQEAIELAKRSTWPSGRFLRKSFKTLTQLVSSIASKRFIEKFKAYRILRSSGLFDPSYYLKLHPIVSFLNENPLWHFIHSGAKNQWDPNPLFDIAYYENQNKDVRETKINPLVHFIVVGEKENRKPHPLFDPKYYRENLKGKIDIEINSLEHFIQSGANKGYDPIRLFDVDLYISRYPDVGASGINPLVHYMESGAAEGRNPHPLFDSAFYLTHNFDAIGKSGNPLVHYIEKGGREGRNPSVLFDGSYYLSKYPEVKETGLTPLEHYLEAGGFEGKNPNPLFDSAYYLRENPDVGQAKINPLVHYVEKGAGEGRNPSVLFNTRFYLDHNPDVKASGVNPLTHYLQRGGEEGRDPCPLFSGSYYLSNYPEALKETRNPLVHYIEKGGREGRNPSVLFDGSYYLSKYPEVKETGLTPLEHYLEAGGFEGKNPNPLFDSAYYLRENPDVGQAKINPLVHYVEKGAGEGRNPSVLFNTRFYLDHNPDVKASGVNPLIHFLDCGAVEGRDPNPAFRSDYYLAENPNLFKNRKNPLVHFIETGAKQGKNPSPFFDTAFYRNRYPEGLASGMNPLAHYLQYGLKKGYFPNPLMDQFKYNPLISIIFLSRQITREKLRQCMDAMRFQIYMKWELILVTGPCNTPDIKADFERARREDSRFRYFHAASTERIPELYNAGIDKAKGSFFLFLKDTLPRMEALFEYVRLLNDHPKARLIFCDQGDPLSPGCRMEDYSRPDLKLSTDYFIGPFILLKKTIVENIGKLGPEHGGPEDRDFLMQYLDKTSPDKVLRISKKLFDPVTE